MVKLAGAPWLRDPAEFSTTFYEAEQLYNMVQGYGIETVTLEQFQRDGTFVMNLMTLEEKLSIMVDALMRFDKQLLHFG